MIESLQLRSFKRHKSLDVSFGPGLTVITGPNYTGKTSIEQAILVALFGVSALPGGAKVATHAGAKGFEIAFVFKTDDATYRVRRTKSTAELSRDGEVIANSVSQVTAEIEKIIGMSRNRFLQIKYAEQKRTAALLTLGAAELHSVIEEITGADVVSQVIEHLKTESTRVAGLMEGTQDAGDPAELESAARVAQNNAVEMEQRAGAYGRAAATAREKESAARRALDEARATNAAVDKQEARLHAARDERDRAAARLAEVEKRAPAEPVSAQAIEEAETELAEYRAEDQQMRDAARDRDAAAEAMDKAKAAGQKAQAASKAVVEPVSEEAMAEAQAADDAAVKSLAEAENRFKAAEQAYDNGICHACGRPLENHDPQKALQTFEDARDEVEKQTQQAKGKRLALQELVDKRRAAEQGQTAVDAAKERLQESIAAYTQAKADFEAADGRIPADFDLPTLRSQISDAQGRLDGLKKAAAVADQQAREYEAAQRELQEAEERVKAVSDTETRVDTKPLAKALSEAEKHAEETRAAESQALRDEMDAKAEARTASDAANAAAKAAEKRRMYEQRANGVRELTNYLRKNRDRFLAEIWAGIMAQASQFASICTGGDIESVQRTDKGSFVYRENGVEQPLEAASGAQESIMGLGVQLALSRLLPSGFRATLLDEPTADMRDDRAAVVSQVLANMGQQVVMVSHREFDSSAATTVIAMEESA